MLSKEEAANIVLKNLPGGKIQSFISYGDLYIFQVFTDIPMEEIFDPFYSVNKETGEFSDFSILTDGNPQIAAMFLQAKGPRS